MINICDKPVKNKYTRLNNVSERTNARRAVVRDKEHKYILRNMSNRKFGRNSTALDVAKGIDLTGKTVLITGANNGIGILFLKIVLLNFCMIILSRFGDRESTGLSQCARNHGLQKLKIC